MRGLKQSPFENSAGEEHQRKYKMAIEHEMIEEKDAHKVILA